MRFACHPADDYCNHGDVMYISPFSFRSPSPSPIAPTDEDVDEQGGTDHDRHVGNAHTPVAQKDQLEVAGTEIASNVHEPKREIGSVRYRDRFRYRPTRSPSHSDSDSDGRPDIVTPAPGTCHALVVYLFQPNATNFGGTKKPRDGRK